MKKFSFVFAVILSLVALPPLADAKDKDKKKDHDDGQKEWAEMRDRMQELRAQNGRVQDSLRTTDLSRSVRQSADAINGEVNRLSGQFDSGKYDRRDLYGKTTQLFSDLARIRQQIDYESQRRGGYDYHRRGDYDRRGDNR
jgi:predicted nuclease with TOPRIM domain